MCFYGVRSAPLPNPQAGGPGYRFLSGSFTFGLSDVEEPTSSYAAISIALRINLATHASPLHQSSDMFVWPHSC